MENTLSSDKHQFKLLDSGVVVALHQVSVSHDQRAVEDVVSGIVLVQDVLDVVHSVGLVAACLVDIGLGGVQV